MAVENDRSAPYAPSSNVLQVIRRYRDRGLPETLSPQELTRLGIPQGNANRTLQALRFLGLVDDLGQRTSSFDRLKNASASDYPGALAEILRSSYYDVFVIIDPAEATAEQVEDAFRIYNPVAQRARMVSLFIGLCREAEIVPGGPMTVTRRTRTTRRSNTVANAKPATPLPQDTSSQQIASSPRAAPQERPTGRYVLLEGILGQLPAEGKWSQDRRDRWLQPLTASLDLLVEIDESDDQRHRESTD